jgi:hypothetical protein
MQAILYFAIPEQYVAYFYYAVDPIVFATKLMITGKGNQCNIRCPQAKFK